MRACVRRWIRQHRPSGVLLEIGGGTSMLRPLIEREAPGLSYLSADIAPTDATSVVLDATDLPVRDGSVDVVVALEVLEHVDEPGRMLAEIDRALGPRGLLVLTVPFMYGIHDYRDYFRFTPLGLEQLLANTGLELRETERRGGTMVSAVGLVRSMIRYRLIGDPGGWRARGLQKQATWIAITILEVPWVPLMWCAMGVDRVIDRGSHNPPGFFFLCAKRPVPATS